MKRTIRNLAIIATLLFPVAAAAYQPMAATIKVSGGGVYDYVLIGESARATDGFDNAYDTLAPGASLNSAWISTYFAHPEWGAAKQNFRGDIRSMSEKQEWKLTIASSLPVGTALTVELQTGLNILPQGLQLTVKDIGNTTSADLISNKLNITAPGPASTANLIITAIQPPTPAPAPEPAPVTTPAPAPVPTPTTIAANGDVTGDGRISLADAVKILRIAVGVELGSSAERARGDVDGDGNITISDALIVLRKTIGLQ